MTSEALGLAQAGQIEGSLSEGDYMWPISGLLFSQPLSIEHCCVPGTVSGSQFIGQCFRAPQCSRLSPRMHGMGWHPNVLSQISFFICEMGTGIPVFSYRIQVSTLVRGGGL